MKRLAWCTAAALLLAVPALASAQDAYVTGNVNLRAGPDIGYPLIATVPAGTPVFVQGCTEGWEWCDVVVYNDRGWVAGDFVQYEYENQRVLVPAYGARIGIPVISFVIGTYWGSHYRDRPFYRERARWYHRPVRYRPPSRRTYRQPSRTVHVSQPRHVYQPRHVSQPRYVPSQRRVSPQRHAATPRQVFQPRPARRSSMSRPNPPRTQSRPAARPQSHAHGSTPSRGSRPTRDSRKDKTGSDKKRRNHGHG